jgi:hypothetical protein
VREDDGAVANIVLIEGDAERRLVQQQLSKSGFAHLDRQSAQVLAGSSKSKAQSTAALS